MKNKKSGFIIPFLITIIALLTIGGVYFYVNKSSNIKIINQYKNNVATTSDSTINTENSSSTQNSKTPYTPYIKNIIPSSAQTGSTIEITGNDFFGFESDVYFFFKRSDGKIVRLAGVISTQNTGNTKETQTAKVILKEPCQKGQTVYEDYSGKPSQCDYIQLTPGIYTVYTKPYGYKSNEVQFTIKESPVICTRDAKLCPNGTYVGRTGPNCEFVCPAS